MTKKSFIISAVLMLFIVATAGFAHADKYQWKLVDTEDGCQIYTSVVPGKEYIAAKATCLIPARIEVIGTILRDTDNYPEWMHDCRETKVLKIVDDKNDVIIFWLRQHVTLYTDRDVIIKSRTVIDDASGTNFVYGDASNDIPYDTGKGYVRMPAFNSLFTLQWVDRENTKVTLMVDPDLGKGLPVGIANGMIKTTPLKSLKKLMKMVKKSNYIEKAKTSKYNKMAEDFVKAGHK
jgi:hypothetical protein